MDLRQLLMDRKEPGERLLPEAEEDFKFPLDGVTPQVVTEGGTVTKCDESNFPALAGNDAAVFLLILKPGGLREPHWHPNAWELDYCVSGNCRLGVVTPDSTQSIVVLGPGDVGFIPQGWGHFIENVGDVDLKCVVVFNSSKPNAIGLSTFFGSVPTATFTEPLV
jgi:oxalate decarboxylase